MYVLAAAVILVGAFCLLDLALTFGVLRRLREHSAVLEGLVNGAPHPARDILVPPRPVGEFIAETVDREPISRDSLGDTVVVFVAPDCPSCLDQLPEVARRAGAYDRGRTLVVIDGQLTDAADLVELLNPVARVVIDTAPDFPVRSAFGVSAFPAACVVIDGKVISTSAEYSLLPELAQV